MKNNIFMLLLCSLTAGVLYGYIASHVNYAQNRSDKGKKVVVAGRDLRGAQLPSLNAANGNFKGTYAQPCVISDDSLNAPGVCISGQTTTMTNSDFTGANFFNSVFRYTDFENSVFKNATAYNADFTSAYFKGCDFTNFNVVDLQATLTVLNQDVTDDSDMTTMDDLESADPADLAVYATTTFCNATMPDGTVCSDDLGTWTDSTSGASYACNCSTSTSDDDSSASS